MSEDPYSDVYDDDYSDDQSQHQNSGGGLRSFAEAQKKENEDLRRQLQELQQARQKEELASALKGKGVNPKAASLALKAGVTPDKVDEWINEYGDVFGVTQSTDQGEEQSGGGVDETTQQQIAEVSGAPTGTVPTNQGDALAQMGSFDNEADFWSYIQSQS